MAPESVILNITDETCEKPRLSNLHEQEQKKNIGFSMAYEVANATRHHHILKSASTLRILPKHDAARRRGAHGTGES